MYRITFLFYLFLLIIV
jgi:hypothetical protein